MPDEKSIEQTVNESKEIPWGEFFLYVVVGFGVYFITSLILGFFLQEIDIFTTVAITSLNAGCFIGTVYFVGILRGRTSWAEMGFSVAAIRLKWLVLAALASLAILPVRMLAGMLVQLLIPGSMDSLQIRTDLLFSGNEFSWLNFLLSILTIGLLVPISEEVYFRGLLHRWFKPFLGFWPRILLSSLIFGIAHFDTPGVLVSSFIMGVFNAFAYEKTDSLWVPITMHAVSNIFAVVVMYVGLALGLGT
jgi:membrane protease YdiL (CAAX protease family)